MGITYVESKDEIEKSPLVATMISSIHDAGQVAKHHFYTHTHATFKDDASPQTVGDLETETSLKEALEYYHDASGLGDTSYEFYSEESKHIPDTFNTDIVFIADPIDGTTNYMNQNDNWGITLSAYAPDENGHIDNPIASVIYRPMAQELLWTSDEEQFVHKNKTFLMTGKGDDVREYHAALQRDQKQEKPLDHKLVTMTLSKSAYPCYYELERELYEQDVSLRSNGSTALTLARVAGLGSNGIVCLGDMKKWDVASGIQLAKNSGCTIIQKDIETTEGEDIPLLIVAKSSAIASELEKAACAAVDPITEVSPCATKLKSSNMKRAKGA